MLYGNVVIVFGLMAFFFNQLNNHSYATFELVGLLLSAGILLATNGSTWHMNWVTGRRCPNG